jgi:transcriptional regulator with XRE-family HTH domain
MPRRSTAAALVPRRYGPTSLKLAIVASGIAQGDIAKHLRISIYRLSRIVRGHQAPTADEQDRLAELLRTSRRSLFRGVSAA